MIKQNCSTCGTKLGPNVVQTSSTFWTSWRGGGWAQSSFTLHQFRCPKGYVQKHLDELQRNHLPYTTSISTVEPRKSKTDKTVMGCLLIHSIHSSFILLLWHTSTLLQSR